MNLLSKFNTERSSQYDSFVLLEESAYIHDVEKDQIYNRRDDVGNTSRILMGKPH